MREKHDVDDDVNEAIYASSVLASFLFSLKSLELMQLT
jgi:hypothetical protein